jgi:hypothetical protein
MKRRNFILLLGGTSSGAMSVGTGAFSSMEAERGVEVNVVEDDDAYVGYRESDKTVPADLRGDGALHLVTVTNRFREAVSIVDVTVGDGADVLAEVSYDGSELGTGEKENITGHVEGLPPGESVEIEVTVTVEGAGVTAQLFGDTETRQFTIERADQDVALKETEVEFFGGGNAEILGDDRTVTVDLHLLDKGSKAITDIEGKQVDTGRNLRAQLSGTGGDGIVGVTLDGTTYVHPQWNSGSCGFDSPSNGGYGVPSDSAPGCGSE